jgi:Icc protein
VTGNAPARGPVRVAQVSDTHLYADPGQTLKGFATDRMLREALAHLAASGFSPQRLVLTGDLVHDGSEAGYRQLATLVRPLGVETLCLPGNHDDGPTLRRILASAGALCGSTHRVGPWLFLLLDTSLPGADYGQLSGDAIGDAARALAASDAEHALVWLHHHPLPVGSRWLDALGLRNAGALWRWLETQDRVRGVVCGHVHQEFSSRRAGIPVWGTPATCMQFAPGRDAFALDALPPGYRRFLLFPDGTVETEVVRLSG